MDFAEHAVDVNPREIFAPHEVRDQARLDRIAESMEAEGWVGRPLLVVGDQSITGTHRLAAAKRVGLDEVPAVVVPESDRLVLRPHMSGVQDVLFDGERLVDDVEFVRAFRELGHEVAALLVEAEQLANDAERAE